MTETDFPSLHLQLGLAGRDFLVFNFFGDFTIFMLPWPWPWPDDLDIRIGTKDSEINFLGQGYQTLVQYTETDRQTDRQMPPNALPRCSRRL